ncbi:ABC transporter ATP-binding protein [Caminibacter mediatlanticus TB-2]|uniref:ABC transporter ATP-binding protein n=1 Tax=Caminibacter mediatlanticus TB-2 TaxID=391592 RepID=A0ABX5V8F2_9BACT|nr:ABC transporter ATP-binding protein [Caminibacter mediatlanticus]QCT94558.1 ABC transporter ATP-binding protein [Caminibacter mediatlanticus TB-2]
MIKIRHLKKVFGKKIVLKDVNLDIYDGKITYILGMSGQGKSTIIKHIVGLLKPTSGEIWVDDVNIANADIQTLYKIRKKVGFTFQEGALFDSMNIFDNVAFPLKEHTKLSKEEIKKRVFETLEMVGLDANRVAYLYPHELSGGMRKRAATARAIILKPKYVLYDEPTSGLDPIISDKITRMIIDLNKNHNMTSVVISHDLKETFKSADYIAMLYQGEIIEFGSVEEFKNSKNPIVQAFIRGDSEIYEKIAEGV